MCLYEWMWRSKVKVSFLRSHHLPCPFAALPFVLELQTELGLWRILEHFPGSYRWVSFYLLYKFSVFYQLEEQKPSRALQPFAYTPPLRSLRSSPCVVFEGCLAFSASLQPQQLALVQFSRCVLSDSWRPSHWHEMYLWWLSGICLHGRLFEFLLTIPLCTFFYKEGPSLYVKDSC